MWKHEIINDLTCHQDYNIKLVDRIKLDCILVNLNNSIQFHFGIIKNINDIFMDAFDNKVPILSKAKINNTFLKFPFKTCLFTGDHSSHTIKIAFLICVDPDFDTKFSIFTFYLQKDAYRHWYLDHELLHCDLYNESIGIESLYPVQGYSDSQYHGPGLTFIIGCLNLLHCKNIVKKENKPPEKLNKKRIKNGKLPLFSYYTLHIKDSINSNSKNVLGDHNRIHLCRGHFKHYTKENPLFGKLTGMYWWQPHVRGQNKDGIIMKDYVVKCA
ncbi:MAG: hypothetical protein WC319_11075 [Candidatus Paceibacterota bacterium]|jgi:hypothetical protein